MATLIFLRGVCGYVWVTIHILSPLRVGGGVGEGAGVLANFKHGMHAIRPNLDLMYVLRFVALDST